MLLITKITHLIETIHQHLVFDSGKSVINKIKFKIGTHDGFFHADEILAIALLKHCFSNVVDFEIVRSRDMKVLWGCDMLIDVGGLFDGDKYFDHHQDKNINCSLALVWTAIVKFICGYNSSWEFYWKYVNKILIEGIDMLDRDYPTAVIERGDPTLYYGMFKYISDMNDVENPNSLIAFNNAINQGVFMWETILKKTKQVYEENQSLRHAIKKDDICFLQKSISVEDHMSYLQDNNIHYITHPHFVSPKQLFRCINSNTHPLPQIVDEYAYFVHATRYLALFDNKEKLNNFLSEWGK